MNFPAELKYTKDHEWVRVEGSDAYIGITEFAQANWAISFMWTSLPKEKK